MTFHMTCARPTDTSPYGAHQSLPHPGIGAGESSGLSHLKPDMVLHTCNSSIMEAEAGEK
jgi:hypothetical protein